MESSKSGREMRREPRRDPRRPAGPAEAGSRHRSLPGPEIGTIARTSRSSRLRGFVLGWGAWLTLCCWLLAVGIAQAHVTSVSYSHVELREGIVSYRLRVTPVDLAVALGIVEDAQAPLDAAAIEAQRREAVDYVGSRIAVFADGRWCEPGAVRMDTARFPEEVEFALRFDCPASAEKLLIQYLVFSEIDAHHATVGQLVREGGSSEFTLNFDRPELEVNLTEPGGGVWGETWRFFLLGMEHILIGYDHILFLFGLIVASLRLRYLVGVISMFTVAHTVTLLLAAFGWVTLPGWLVESAIALSIVYIAVENLAGWGMRYRWAVTFGFGLVHGLGFASVLAGLTAARQAHVAPLFAFNAGVEAGQMVILSLVLPVLLGLARLGLQAPVMRAGSVAILVVALYWFGERAFWG